MRNDPPLAALQRRLGLAPEPEAAGDGGDNDGGGNDDGGDDGGLSPSWVPDGRPGRGEWLARVRADPGRAGAAVLAGIAALAVLITVFTLARSHPAPVVSAKLPPVQPQSSPQSSTAASPPPSTSVVVSVVGLVHEPGLVTLAPDARIADAVSAAGGVLSGADTLGLNMARHVDDGEQIVVGIAAPAGHPPALGSSAGGTAPERVAPARTTATAAPAAPVNLNTATAEQLDALPGVGPVTAAAIVAWRAANGRFTSVDQLAEVDGIGPARLEKLRPLLRV